MTTTKQVVIPGDPDDLICDTCPNRYASRGDTYRTFESARVAGWHIYQRVQIQFSLSSGEGRNLVETRILCPSCIGTPRTRAPKMPELEGQSDILGHLGIEVTPLTGVKKGKKGREMS